MTLISTCSKCGATLEYRREGWGPVGEGPRRDMQWWGCPKCDREKYAAFHAKATNAAPDAGDGVSYVGTGEVATLTEALLDQIADETWTNDTVREAIANILRAAKRQTAAPDAGDVEALRRELRVRMAPFAAWSSAYDVYRGEYGRTPTEEQAARMANVFATRESAENGVLDYVVNLIAAREAQLRGAVEALLVVTPGDVDNECPCSQCNAVRRARSALATPVPDAAQRVLAVIDAAREFYRWNHYELRAEDTGNFIEDLERHARPLINAVKALDGIKEPSDDEDGASDGRVTPEMAADARGAAYRRVLDEDGASE